MRKAKQLMPSYEELYERVVQEGVIERRREWLISKLQAMTPEVEGEFLYWWHTGKTLDKVKIQDLTVGWIFENKFYAPLDVFIDFDALCRDPEDSYLYRCLRWGRTVFIDTSNKA